MFQFSFDLLFSVAVNFFLYGYLGYMIWRAFTYHQHPPEPLPKFLQKRKTRIILWVLYYAFLGFVLVFGLYNVLHNTI